MKAMSIGKVVWIYGRPGSGKTTLGRRLAQENGCLFLDSDYVRQVLGAPKDFSMLARQLYQSNLRLHARELQWRGNDIVVASITPLRTMRIRNKKAIHDYTDIYLECSLEEAIRRDPKGLYAKALNGEIDNFTGISSPFEEPDYQEDYPSLTVNTERVDERTAYYNICLHLSLEEDLCL